MLDCGMHMGYQDERRFPYFSYVTGGTGRLTEHIDCVIISHFVNPLLIESFIPKWRVPIRPPRIRSIGSVL